MPSAERINQEFAKLYILEGLSEAVGNSANDRVLREFLHARGVVVSADQFAHALSELKRQQALTFDEGAGLRRVAMLAAGFAHLDGSRALDGVRVRAHRG